MEQLAATVGAFLKGIMPVTFGAAVSAFIQFKVVKDDSNLWERWGTFFFGVGLAHVFGGAAIEYYMIPEESMTATAIKVLTAIFVMSAATQAYIQIPALAKGLRVKIVEKFGNIIDRLTGN
jgi:hypothetical protein